MGYLMGSLRKYCLREMSGVELWYLLFFFSSFFFLLLRQREKINFTPNVHFSALYWKLKFLSVWHEIFAFLRETKKSNWERRRWMLLPLLNTQITSSFSQEMKHRFSFVPLCENVCEFSRNKQVTYPQSLAVLSQLHAWISMSSGSPNGLSLT